MFKKPRPPLRIFGTDGIRARPFEFPLEPRILKSLGAAFGSLLGSRGGDVLFAQDTRLSSSKIFKYLAQGFSDSGFIVYRLGVLPTPSLSYLVRRWRAVLGCVVSASHNPPEFNGVKFFNSKGHKVTRGWEDRIEQFLSNRAIAAISRKARVNHREREAYGAYKDFLQSQVAADIDFRGLRIVLDCANGANSLIAPELFALLGARVEVIGIHPNGNNINLGVGAMAPERLAQAVVRLKAHAGFAYDGDGDRLAVVDEQGRLLAGEWVMASLALYRKKTHAPGSHAIVSTCVSNFALKHYLETRGIEVCETPVGDRWVLEKLLSLDAGFGGENSGHYIWPLVLPAADGLLSSLFIAELIKRYNKPLSRLIARFPLLPQVSLNVPIDRARPALEGLRRFQQELNKLQRRLDHQGRVLVRYSGTEPILRILLEGEYPKATLQAMAQHLANIYKSEVRHGS